MAGRKKTGKKARKYRQGAASYIGGRPGKSRSGGSRPIAKTRRARKAILKSRRLKKGPKLKVGQSKTIHARKKGTAYKITRVK